jgi:hypothetical protein
MGVTRAIQNALNSGELSPRLTMREDYERYANGLKTLRNFIPLPTGGVITQYGQQWIAQTKDAAQAYLWSFEYSTTQAYVIEVGNLYMRFYRDGGRIYDLNGTVAGAANNGAGLIRITDVAHGLSTGNYVYITGTNGTDEANGEWVVTVITADTFDLQGSAFTNTYTSGGLWTRPYEIVSPYALADIPDVKMAQSADTLYLVHPSYAPRKLTRSSHTTWTITTITFLDGPYMETNATTTTLQPSAATGAGVTVTASAVTGINNDTGFQTTDVGRFIRMQEGTVWGYCLITARASTVSVTVTVLLTLTDATTKDKWRLGSWSVTTGYPSAITIFEQRMVFAETTTEQQHLWLSTTGSYEDMSPSATGGTVADSDAVTYQLGSNKVNAIRWLSGAQQLYIGTVGEEFSMTGATLEAVSAINPPLVRSGTTEGSDVLQPVRIGSRVIFLQRSGRELRELTWSDGEQTLVTEELSLIAEHLLRSPNFVVTMAYQNKPNRTIWLVRSDGALLAFCNYVVEKVRAWSLMGSTGASGLYKWVTVIPSVDLLDDQAWFVMHRTVGGVAKYFVEMQNQDISVHSGLVYSGAPILAVDGLEHLNGETVRIVGDGAVYDDQVVVQGSVDLAYGATAGPAASEIYIGLAITPNPSGSTLEPAIKDQAGSTRYKRKHWASLAFEIEETLGLTINGKTQVQYRTPADPMDSVEPTFTGTKQIANLGWSRNGSISWEQTLPLPATVLGYSGELEIAD